MSFKLKTLKSTNVDYLQKLLKQFEISDNKDSSCYELNKSEEIEKQLLDNIIQRAIENKTKLHILYDERDISKSIPCGLLALNFEVVGDFSALSIDFIFISKNYRGIFINEIDSKISAYLLEFALMQAVEMNKVSQLDAVILNPINECVSKIYIEFGFEEFGDGWLYFLIDDID
ncbi:MAG: hypothetical protein U9N59_02015 [Campylobacterota bacterium]|nr:hypothetical protein [Campylobacterota bacterium]